MIKRLIAVLCYVTGALLVIAWMMNDEPEPGFGNSHKKNYISILLIVLLWAAPFLLFRRSGNNDES